MPAADTLARAVGGGGEGLCIVDTKSRPGYAHLPDKRWITAQEWRELCERYRGAGGALVVEIDR